MSYHLKCKGCGISFISYKNPKQQFHSKACYTAWQKGKNPHRLPLRTIQRKCTICNGQLKALGLSPKGAINSYECIVCGAKQYWDRYSKPKGQMRLLREKTLFCRDCKRDVVFVEAPKRRMLICSVCSLYYSTKWHFFYRTRQERNREFARIHNGLASVHRQQMILKVAQRDTSGKIKCVECGMTLNFATARLEHIIPLPLSWTCRKHTRKFMDNLEILCQSCNIQKGYEFDTDFMRMVAMDVVLNPKGLYYEDWFKENMYW